MPKVRKQPTPTSEERLPIISDLKEHATPEDLRDAIPGFIESIKCKCRHPEIMGIEDRLRVVKCIFMENESAEDEDEDEDDEDDVDDEWGTAKFTAVYNCSNGDLLYISVMIENPWFEDCVEEVLKYMFPDMKKIYYEDPRYYENEESFRLVPNR
jgi:hypothetical protein